MTARPQHRSRRIFLTDLGRTALGLVVVGTAACSDDATPSAAGDASAAPTATAAPESTAAADASEAAGTSEADDTGKPDDTSEEAASDIGRTLRVDLGFVSAYVVVRGGQATIVDTGVVGSEGAIDAILTEAGVGWGGVGDVILTHSHGDHAGSITAVADAAPSAALHAGGLDIPNIDAPRDLLAASDGDVIAGLRVIATPGHTPGHIALFDAELGGGTLFAGDAINNVGGDLTGPNAQFSADHTVAIASAQILTALQPQTVYFGHGIPLQEAAAPLEDLAARL